MAYIVRHVDKEGHLNTEVRTHKGTSLIQGVYQGGVDVSGRAKRFENPGYNQHPSGSAQARKAEVKAELNELRKEYTHTNGFSKDKGYRHVARIPAESWHYARSRGYGDALVNNQKELKRFCQEHQFNVVPNDSW